MSAMTESVVCDYQLMGFGVIPTESISKKICFFFINTWRQAEGRTKPPLTNVFS